MATRCCGVLGIFGVLVFWRQQTKVVVKAYDLVAGSHYSPSLRLHYSSNLIQWLTAPITFLNYVIAPFTGLHITMRLTMLNECFCNF